jgi:hypothetical protein
MRNFVVLNRTGQGSCEDVLQWKYKKCPTSASVVLFVVIYYNLFCFSVAIFNLSANIAIKFKFCTFYAMKLTENVLFPFATNYHFYK